MRLELANIANIPYHGNSFGTFFNISIYIYINLSINLSIYSVSTGVFAFSYRQLYMEYICVLKIY